MRSTCYRNLFVLACLILVRIETVEAKEPGPSGPQPGAKPGPYSFLVATGTEKGQLTCYVCETAEKPGIIIFARSLSEPLARLVVACDNTLTSRPKDSIRGWLTVLGEKTATPDELGKWAKQTGLKTTPVGIFDDPVGPPSYKLADDADITILLFENRKVVENFAFAKGAVDADAIKRVSERMKQFGAKK
jgi:hypothetical protein